MIDHDNMVMITDRCPVVGCGSRSIHRHELGSAIALSVTRAWGNKNECPIDQCMECAAIWEPWPDGTSSDCVEREPCDNCAYRAGSRESADKEEWQRLTFVAKEAAELGVTGAGRFACHKGIPIKLNMDTGDGQASIEFDYVSAGIDPLAQTCAGFLKMMWAFQKD